LMLVGTNNQPLVAELKQFNNDEINRRDMQTALIGGLQGLGKILTQSNSQTQITTSGTAISTTTSNPNVLGGVLDGASSTLVQQWAQRNQTQIQRLENNARVWFLPSGSRVSLYTTKSFEIN
jgi:Bacterial conjugation TrbI-like protein